MKLIKIVLGFMLFLVCSDVKADDWGLVKGIAHGIGNFFEGKDWKKIGGFFKQMGYSFGAPPHGYDFTCTIFNETNTEKYLGIQDIVSFMGASFPQSHGYSLYPIQAFGSYDIIGRRYYFELQFKDSKTIPSNHMPYLDKDSLFVYDCITLKEKHSKKHHYFRFYTGRSLQGGKYVYGPQAEYVGYSLSQDLGKSTRKKKDKSTATLSNKLSSIVIHNTTGQDVYIGLTTDQDDTIMKDQCQYFSLVEKDSFATLTAYPGESLRPGSLGVFDVGKNSTKEIYKLAEKGFDGKTYTFVVYQNAGEGRKIDAQGLMPGHYDIPSSQRVRDITPIISYFWRQSPVQSNQSIANQKNLTNLAGQVWIVAQGHDLTIKKQANPGQVVQWNMVRPRIGQKQSIYFLYLDTQDQKKGEQFIDRFLAGKIGQGIVQQYNAQAAKQSQLAQKSMQKNLLEVPKGKSGLSVHVAKQLLIDAVEGSLKMNRGEIVDDVTQVTGYLLGSDVFLSAGVGATVQHYILPPFQKTPSLKPTTGVQNLYASTLSGKAPKGWPATSAGKTSQETAKKVKPKKAKDTTRIVKPKAISKKQKPVTNVQQSGKAIVAKDKKTITKNFFQPKAKSSVGKIRTVAKKASEQRVQEKG